MLGSVLDEKRKLARVPTGILCRWHREGEAARYAMITNLSEGGCRLSLIGPPTIEVGSVVHLEIPQPGKPGTGIRYSGFVRHVHGRQVGIAFGDVEDEKMREALRSYILEVAEDEGTQSH